MLKELSEAEHSEVDLVLFSTAVMSRAVAIFELPCEASKEGALIGVAAM